MDKNMKAVFVAGMHRIICSPRQNVGKGRFIFLPPPAYGSPECHCHKMTLKYNGKEVSLP